MADGYGSKAKPVALDPFQTIVSVHWAGTFLLLSFGLKVNSTPQGERGTGPGPDLVTPFSEAFVTEATPAFDPVEPGVKVWTGSQWVNAGSDDVSVSGTPSAPSAASFDAWMIQGVSVAENGLYAPYLRFFALTGDHPTISLPSAASYFTDLTVDGEMVAQDFISEPQPLPVGGDVPLWATYNPVPAQKSTFTLDVSGLSAVYRGRTYQAIATRVTGQMEYNTGTLEVLMQRHAVTA